MRLVLTSLFIVCSLVAATQGVKGRTLDQQGVALPFATVHLKGTTVGTTSNGEGVFRLRIDKPGNYTLVVKHIGFQQYEQSITVGQQMTELDIRMKAEVIELSEVVVSSDKEDPAYRVIREAIKKRKFYEKEINAYSCDVYIKGLQRLDTFPDKILGIQVTLDTGIVYLSESVSKLKFMQPNKISERMISSKVSGNNRAFSFNQASEMIINLYQNTFELQGLSERPFVSPIANGAMLFYDYELVGIIREDDLIINKIKLKPKRKTDPVFDGHIYIIEDSWRLYNVDVLVTKSRGIEFVDSLTISQVFTPARAGIYVPMSQRFGFQFNVFNIQGSGYFNAVYSNYDIEPDYDLIEKETGVKLQEIKLFTKSDFTNEIMYVEDGANEKDSTYWSSIRPIPLNQAEVKDYQVKDSIRLVRESKAYQDSVDHERNKLTPGKLLLTGYGLYNTYERRRFIFPTILQSLQYNTVEGVATDLGFRYEKRDEDNRLKYFLDPHVRYGFSNEKFHARSSLYIRQHDKKFTSYWFGGGRYVAQLNESLPLTAFNNTFNALFFGESPIKYFEKGYVFARFRQEIRNGLMMAIRVEYANRNELFNTADYSFVGEGMKNFDSNQPYNEEIGDTARFAQHQAFFVDLNLRIRFNQKYQTRPDRKIIYQTRTPDLYIELRQGLPTLGSDVNYTRWRLRVQDNMNLGLVGTSEYSVASGGFLSTKELTFLDFQHFNGNRLNWSRIDQLNSFQLLDYYRFSTTSNYVEAHFEHHFNEFILNKVPLIKKLNWQTVFSAHYLTTPDIGNYAELGFGIEHIFKFMRIDYFLAIRNGNVIGEFPQKGIRIGVGF